MKKKKRINRVHKLERRMYKASMFLMVVLIIGIIYSRATISKINLEIQDLNDTIDTEYDSNQNLAMKINEMVSLDKIQEVSSELGLKYDNDNIKTVIE